MKCLRTRYNPHIMPHMTWHDIWLHTIMFVWFSGKFTEAYKWYNLGNVGKRQKLRSLPCHSSWRFFPNLQGRGDFYSSTSLHGTTHPGFSPSLSPALNPLPLSGLGLFSPQSKLFRKCSNTCKSKKTNTHQSASANINVWLILFRPNPNQFPSQHCWIILKQIPDSVLFHP